MSTHKTCPKCQDFMEEGVVSDGGFARYWFRGIPKVSWNGRIKVSWKERLPVITYRCTGCGYLETYTRKEEP